MQLQRTVRTNMTIYCNHSGYMYTVTPHVNPCLDTYPIDIVSNSFKSWSP